MLESKATHGLVAPEEFPLPPLHKLWTSDAYFAFDIKVVSVMENQLKSSTELIHSN